MCNKNNEESDFVACLNMLVVQIQFSMVKKL